MKFDIAQRAFARSVSPVEEIVKVSCTSASGRVIAEDLSADIDVPTANVSTTDGYAVRSAEHVAGGRFTIQEYICSHVPPTALRSGHTSWVPRGMAIPCGADAVVPAHETAIDLSGVSLLKAPPHGHNVLPRGSTAKVGERLISNGTLLRPWHIATLALQGMDRVAVYRKVNAGIGILGQTDPSHDGHGLLLESMLGQMGAGVTCRSGVPDYRALRRSLEMLSRQADLILLVAATNDARPLSTADMLAAAGAALVSEDVVMVQGESTVLGRFGQTPVLWLPESYAGTLMSFALLVTPMLRTLQGRSDVFPPVGQTKLAPGAILPNFRAEDPFWCVAQDITQGNWEVSDGRVSCHLGGSIFALEGVNAILRTKRRAVGLGQEQPLAYYDLSHWLR